MKINNWGIILRVYIVLSLFAIGYLLIKNCNQEVDLALTKISKKQSEKDLKMIVEILNNTDLSKKDVLNEIAKNKLYEISKLENDKIELEKIYLVFEKDKFKKIENKMNLSYE